MAEGFLGRWAQRKADARQGKPLEEPAPTLRPTPAPAPTTLTASTTAPTAPALAPLAGAGASGDTAAPPGQAVPDTPPLTLQDANRLGQDSDFKPFVARDVDPAVRNAAMKKLFSDPHYNVMDRLDTYIDDYSHSDPLPLSMLHQMASAQFLNLLDDDKDKSPTDVATPSVPRTAEEASAQPPVAADPAANETAALTRQDHAHTDLRLQPDHAPGSPGPGRGAQ